MSPTRKVTEAHAFRPTAGRVLALASLAALLLSGASARIASAACSTAICVGSATACTISGSNTIDDDCVLNWSGKDVTLASGASMKTAADGQNFEIQTDDFDVLDPNGVFLNDHLRELLGV